MSYNLDKLCSDFLTKVQLESDFITNQIDKSYTEDKDKLKLAEKYQEQIDDFLSKYNHTFVRLTNEDTNEFLGLDKKCGDKLDVIVDKFKNYIINLKE